MITTKQLNECDLTHKYGGNGFVMVEDLDKEYCRVTEQGTIGPASLILLAAKSLLSPTVVIYTDTDGVKQSRQEGIYSGQLHKLTEIRTGITSGKLKVEKNRVVKA